MEIVNSINDALWSYVITIVLVGAAIYFTVRSRGVQFRFLKDALRIMAGRDRNTHKSALAHPKKIGSFKAFSVSLASRVGTGNLAGVASAMFVGGPGISYAARRFSLPARRGGPCKMRGIRPATASPLAAALLVKGEVSE